MQVSNLSNVKHLRELIKFAEEKMGTDKVVAERRGTSAKLRGTYTHDGIAHPFEINVALSSADQRAFVNGQADIVATVNDIKASLGLPIIRGIAQVQKSTKPPKPFVKVNKTEREKLTLFGKAKATSVSDPTHLDANPFEALGRLRKAMNPIPDTHTLMVLDQDGWKEESKFTSESGIERRALTLLRAGKAVSIKWAE